MFEKFIQHKYSNQTSELKEQDNKKLVHVLKNFEVSSQKNENFLSELPKKVKIIPVKAKSFKFDDEEDINPELETFYENDFLSVLYNYFSQEITDKLVLHVNKN